MEVLGALRFVFLEAGGSASVLAKILGARRSADECISCCSTRASTPYGPASQPQCGSKGGTNFGRCHRLMREQVLRSGR